MIIVLLYWLRAHGDAEFTHAQCIRFRAYTADLGSPEAYRLLSKYIKVTRGDAHNPTSEHLDKVL